MNQPMEKPIDLLEVFCSEKGNLTNQVNQLGGRAIRFGLPQGDLQTAEGRKALFAAQSKVWSMVKLVNVQQSTIP